MSRFFSVFRCEAEHEVDGNVVYLWERLFPAVEVGPDAKPRWDYEQIVFYRPVERDHIHVNRHLMFSRGASPDVLVLQNGLCVEITSGQVVWRESAWFIRWHGYTHTRMARATRAALDVWKSAD